MDLSLIAKSIQAVKDSVPAILTGTVVSTLGTGDVLVQLDNDPSGDAVTARGLGNAVLVSGTRVICLRYPPRGLLVLGAWDWSALDLLAARLRLTATDDLTLTSVLHAFQIGPDSGANLAMDTNEIMARNNGLSATLAIQADGGNITLGSAGFLVQLPSTSDVSPSTTDHPFQIGPSNADNLRLDRNEIMAVSNGVASTLDINNDGGTVRIGNTSGANGVLCVAMGAFSIVDTSTRSTASTTFVDGGTTATLQITDPPSHTLLISIGSRLSNGSATVTHSGVISFEVRDQNAGGTLLLAASDNNGAVMTRQASGATDVSVSKTVAVTLPAAASGVYFIRAMIRSNNAANTMTALQTVLTVMPSM